MRGAASCQAGWWEELEEGGVEAKGTKPIQGRSEMQGTGQGLSCEGAQPSSKREPWKESPYQTPQSCKQQPPLSWVLLSRPHPVEDDSPPTPAPHPRDSSRTLSWAPGPSTAPTPDRLLPPNSDDCSSRDRETSRRCTGIHLCFPHMASPAGLCLCPPPRRPQTGRLLGPPWCRTSHLLPSPCHQTPIVHRLKSQILTGIL